MRMAKFIRLCGATALVLWITLCGCRICDTPYDYCSATSGPDGNPCFCDFGARYNSAFAPPRGTGMAPHGPTEVTAASVPARDNVGEAIDGFDGLQAAVRDGLASDSS